MAGSADRFTEAPSHAERLPSWSSRLQYVESTKYDSEDVSSAAALVAPARTVAGSSFVPAALPTGTFVPPQHDSEGAASQDVEGHGLHSQDCTSLRGYGRVKSQHPHIPSGTSAEMRAIGFQAVSLKVNHALAEGIFRVVVDAYAKVGGTQFASVDEFIADIPLAFVVREDIGASAADADIVTAFLGAKQTPAGAKYTVVAASGEEGAVRGRQAVRDFLSQLAQGRLPAAYIEVRGPTLAIMSRAVAPALAAAKAGAPHEAAATGCVSGAAAPASERLPSGAALIPVEQARVLLPGKELLPVSDDAWEAAKACRDAPRGLDSAAEAALRNAAYVRVITGLGPKVKVMFGCLRLRVDASEEALAAHSAAARGGVGRVMPLAAVADRCGDDERAAPAAVSASSGPVNRPPVPGLHAARSAPY